MFPCGLTEKLVQFQEERHGTEFSCVCSLGAPRNADSLRNRSATAHFYRTYILVNFSTGRQPCVLPLQELTRVSQADGSRTIFASVKKDVRYWAEVSVTGLSPPKFRRQIVLHWVARRWMMFTERKIALRSLQIATAPSPQPGSGLLRRSSSGADRGRALSLLPLVKKSEKAGAIISAHKDVPRAMKHVVFKYGPTLLSKVFFLFKLYTNFFLQIVRSIWLLGALVIMVVRLSAKCVMVLVRLFPRKEQPSAAALPTQPQHEDTQSVQPPLHDVRPSQLPLESAIKTATSNLLHRRDFNGAGDKAYDGLQYRLLTSAHKRNSSEDPLAQVLSPRLKKESPHSPQPSPRSPRGDTGAYFGLGMLLLKIKPALAANYLDHHGAPPEGGMLVIEVHEGSRAKRANMCAGDLIVLVDGTPVFSADDVKRLCSKNDCATLKIRRPDGSSVLHERILPAPYA
ncbi:hypothetical protein CYMTET_21748 [Cymbomonas tetramitiformis]|uniref:PDZ domain-containing protein n=1 Tax=Cymbomonas tetramitiformis TaxID=36881 RepID=A0AAE0G1Y1_9CHLO|nr:hypothetical protein CYMTET_21748 [Cymbomonas tetramitiformis]